MTQNSSKKAEVLFRREKVTRLRLRHLSLREIVQELDQQGIRNPRTHEPYDLTTIHRDIRALEREWEERAAEDMARHKGELIAELREARRQAWDDDKLSYVLRSIEQEAKILGLVGADSAAAARAREEENIHRATEDFRLGAQAMRDLYAQKQASKKKEQEEPESHEA
jgi:hypothetical protein